jgi:hypothetical protein
MKLIQTYCTKNGETYNCGFPSFQSLINFWNKALEMHLQNYEVIVYTDQQGYNKIKDLLLEGVNFIIIDYPYVDDRYYNISKFQTYIYHANTNPNSQFIHVDIDAILNDIVTDIVTDIVCEMVRPCEYGRYLRSYGLHKIDIEYMYGVPCSGLLGFKNSDFAKQYAEKALLKITESDEEVILFDALWAVEEILLENELEDNNMSYSTFSDFTHLQGRQKR